MLEILAIIASILVVLILIPLSWIWGGYNSLVKGRENVRTMMSNIKTEYQRRADLFYNLAEAVKSYAKFEKQTLTDVIAMRNGNFGATPKEMMAKMKNLEGLISRLLLVVEKYPKLKAMDAYKELMDEVKTTENRVNIVRTEYNDTVREYNLYVQSFPSNFLAGMFNFKVEEYFENEAGTEKAPKMDLKI